MSLRPITPKDGPALAEIHAQAFDTPWSADELVDLLATGAFGAMADDGFILCREGGGESEILTLCVTPAARRKGTGRQLVEVAVQDSEKRGAQTLFLEVAADNLAAIGLYQAAGFEQAGIRRGYYARDEARMIDALILSRALNSGPQFGL